jgi:hypothetical protein
VLTDPERDLVQGQALSETIDRLNLAKSCEKLITKDLFEGLDNHSPLSRAVRAVGQEKALMLMKTRLPQLVGDDLGDIHLRTLRHSLRKMHNMYESGGYKKVMARIDRYKKEYGISPAQWAEVQAGGNLQEVAGRAYEQFQRQYGVVGRAWHAIPNMWHASKIGFAGWREEREGALRKLREAQGDAINVLSILMDEDTQRLIDQASAQDTPTLDDLAKDQQSREQQDVKGLDLPAIQARHDAEWTAYAAAYPTAPTTVDYDHWRTTIFEPEYGREVTVPNRNSWVTRIMRSLFNIRAARLARPAGL